MLAGRAGHRCRRSRVADGRGSDRAGVTRSDHLIGRSVGASRVVRRGSRITLAALAILAAGGPLAGPADVAGADEARTLRIGIIGDLDSINPHLALSDEGAEAVNLQYDLLVGFGPDLEYAPTGFAEAWIRDASTWTFTTHEGMRWSDGVPADAGDVAFTFEYLLASMDPAYVGPWAPGGNDLPGAGASRPDGVADHRLSLYGEVLTEAIGLTAVELLDDRTVALTAAAPGTLLLGAAIPILPEHVWSDVTFEQAATESHGELPVVGTGPFQIVGRDIGRSVTFGRNRFYPGPTPFVEEIRFQAYEDATALTGALRRGEIDYARPIEPGRFRELDTDPAIVGVEGAGSSLVHVAFNAYAEPIDGGGASTSAVRDPLFRDALGFALDRGALIDAALDGHGAPGSSLMPPAFVPFHREPTRPRSFDPAAARERLAEAGYRDADADGIREDADGAPIDLRLLYPTDDPMYGAAARGVERDWEAVGVGITATGLEPDTLTERLYAPEAGGTAEYDVVLWSWQGTPDPDFLLSVLTTSEIGGWSDSSYSDPEYDALFDQQRRAVTSDARRALVARMADIVYDDAPYHVLFYPHELHAYRDDKFAGWSRQPRDGGVPLFTQGVGGYLALVPAADVSSPSPSTVASQPPASSPSETAVPIIPGLPAEMISPLLAAVLALLALAAVGLIVHRLRQRSAR